MSPSSPQPPTSARTAIGLMWGGAVLSLLSIILLLTQTGAIREQAESNLYYDVDDLVNTVIAFGVIFGLVATGLWAWMAVMNGMGRNWARITATCFGALQIGAQAITLVLVGAGVGYGAMVDGEAINPVIQGMLGVCVMSVAITALFLMWQPSASQWYDAMGRARQALRMSVQPAPVQVPPPHQM